MAAIWEKLIAWLWPARCDGCNVRGEYLCAACAATLARSTEAAPPGTLALYDYADPRIKRLIWRLKYRGHRALAGEGGRLLHDGLLETLAEAEEWQPALLGEPRLLLPAPLAAGRRRRRGYNQAAELARALARASPELWELQTGWLIKIRETPSQVSLRDRRARLNNLRGAFALGPAALVRGRRVLVVDDVITTGATMAEARRVLQAAGAKSVLGLALARG